MPRKNKLMMLGVIFAFICGIVSWTIWESSPVVGIVVLAFGFVGFFMTVISNIVLKRKQARQD